MVQSILTLPPAWCTALQAAEVGRSWVKEAKVIPIATFHTRCLRHAAWVRVRCRPAAVLELDSPTDRLTDCRSERRDSIIPFLLRRSPLPSSFQLETQPASEAVSQFPPLKRREGILRNVPICLCGRYNDADYRGVSRLHLFVSSLAVVWPLSSVHSAQLFLRSSSYKVIDTDSVEGFGLSRACARGIHATLRPHSHEDLSRGHSTALRIRSCARVCYVFFS